VLGTVFLYCQVHVWAHTAWSAAFVLLLDT
jgi:hypothetical protein